MSDEQRARVVEKLATALSEAAVALCDVYVDWSDCGQSAREEVDDLVRDAKAEAKINGLHTERCLARLRARHGAKYDR